MKLALITLSGVKINDDIYEAIIPAVDGEIAVFPGHERIVTLATNGVISIRRKKSDLDEAMDSFATYGGVVEIAPDKITILVDAADTADEIMAEEARAALERAEDLKRNAKNRVELEKAQALIDRHSVQLKVAGLKRRHKR